MWSGNRRQYNYILEKASKENHRQLEQGYVKMAAEGSPEDCPQAERGNKIEQRRSVQRSEPPLAAVRPFSGKKELAIWAHGQYSMYCTYGYFHSGGDYVGNWC